MEKEIVKEICKNLKWYEKVVVRAFRKICVKCYLKGHIDTFNNTNL